MRFRHSLGPLFLCCDLEYSVPALYQSNLSLIWDTHSRSSYRDSCQYLSSLCLSCFSLGIHSWVLLFSFWPRALFLPCLVSHIFACFPGNSQYHCLASIPIYSPYLNLFDIVSYLYTFSFFTIIIALCV